MIKKTFGPTTVYVCENTAHCSVYFPTDTLLNIIVEDIEKSNYVVDIIYDKANGPGQALQKQLGGEVVTDEDVFDNVVDSYS